MAVSVVYDGVDLAEIAEVASIDFKAMADIADKSEAVPGRDGAAFLGADMSPLDIAVTFRLSADGIDPAQVQEKWRRFVPHIRKPEPRSLSFGQGVWYKAVAIGSTDISQVSYSGKAEVTFRCYDPIAYGDERRATVPSGGSVEIMVGGSWKTYLRIEASAIRDVTTGLWGLRVDNNDYLRIATGASSARAIYADCEERKLTIAGAYALPTLDSDWLALEPGAHTITNDQGTGAASIAWTERWI